MLKFLNFSIVQTKQYKYPTTSVSISKHVVVVVKTNFLIKAGIGTYVKALGAIGYSLRIVETIKMELILPLHTLLTKNSASLCLSDEIL